MSRNEDLRFITLVALFSVALILVFSSNTIASTTVYFEAEGLPGIAALQFDVLDSTIVAASDFNGSLPSDWLDMTNEGSMTFNAFGDCSLQTGIVGTFDADITLGNWIMGDQDANALAFGQDYTVDLFEGDYTIRAVPIPSAILLFGGGLLGMLGIRRKIKK